MDYHFHDFIGNVGVILILVTYFLVQIRKLYATSLPYIIANCVGAVLILYSLAFDFNLSAVIIESAWLLISLIGLGHVLKERRNLKKETSEGAP